jgi:hypothetical protein
MLRSDAHFVDFGEKHLKNISRPLRVFALATGAGSGARPARALSVAP